MADKAMLKQKGDSAQAGIKEAVASVNAFINERFLRKRRLEVAQFIHAHLFIRDAHSGDLWWVSSGAGCQSLRRDRKSAATVNDCHAENLALKAFRAFLWANAAESSSFFRCLPLDRARRKPAPAMSDDEAKLRLRRRYELIFYTSKVPCGACSIQKGSLLTKSRTRSAAQRAVEGTVWTETEPGFGFREARIKPVRKDIPRNCISFTLSCTDKLLRTQLYGIQGNYLSNIYTPLYISQVFIAGDAADASGVRSALAPKELPSDFFSLGGKKFAHYRCRPFKVDFLPQEADDIIPTALSFSVHYSPQKKEYIIEFLSAKTGLKEGATLRDKANAKCISQLSSFSFAQRLQKLISESGRLFSLWTRLSADRTDEPRLKQLAMEYYCLSTRLKTALNF